MKKNLHPEKKPVTVIMNDGTQYISMLSVELPDELRLEIDPTTHPAWQPDGARRLLNTGGQVSRFGNRYGDLGLAKTA